VGDTLTLSYAGKAQNSLILIGFRNKTGSGTSSHVTISARASSRGPIGFRENPGEVGRTPPNGCPPCCRLRVGSGASSHVTISARASLRGPIGFRENLGVAGRTPPYGCPPCYRLRVLSPLPRLSVPCVPVSFRLLVLLMMTTKVVFLRGSACAFPVCAGTWPRDLLVPQSRLTRAEPRQCRLPGLRMPS